MISSSIHPQQFATGCQPVGAWCAVQMVQVPSNFQEMTQVQPASWVNVDVSGGYPFEVPHWNNNVYAPTFLPVQKYPEQPIPNQFDKPSVEQPAPTRFDKPSSSRYFRDDYADNFDEETVAPASDGLPEVSSSASGNSDDEWHGSLPAQPVSVPVREKIEDLERDMTYRGDEPTENLVTIDKEEGKRRGSELLSMLSDFTACGGSFALPPMPPPSTHLPPSQAQPSQNAAKTAPSAASLPMSQLNSVGTAPSDNKINSQRAGHVPRVVPPRVRVA
eukprot:gnl/TRDRNA2_/TRDRNA2_92784_c0_seq1.p1 gnl/TRDRNA2_/TRDRNA2_92784_c0~~gnl/TRDRNA2_/TRDRNA2_92784_c0_seq1.p1  ORF type:complete len:275 (+),score=36.94 gnl/TRDRNA2_/TRDRNA2_92784_c0_seq1:42-866(+)